MTRKQALSLLLETPYKLGHLLGFDKLTLLHNDWIVDMVRSSDDKTLQAHRGSYKTTCVSIALAILVILLPNKRIMFMRKTDTDIKEIVRQVQKILESEYIKALVQSIHGVNLILTTSSVNEISTNLSTDIKGTSQIVSMGIGASLTGKHFDIIFTDDIVNIKDKSSKAERDYTKIIYQELQNLINRGGRIYNTGTPWHSDDAFSLMPNPQKYDCYSTGLISSDELDSIKNKMTKSLFSANYELRHVAEDDVIFTNPRTGADSSLVEQGECHVDAAYSGEDFTAFTICRKLEQTYYVYGRIWRKHIDDCEDEILELRAKYMAGRIYCEDNGDKGYLGKSLKKKGARIGIYHESTNKYIKITSYLKDEWANIVFVDGTDTNYINQICDYNENAEHDDAPDSLASIIRQQWRR